MRVSISCQLKANGAILTFFIVADRRLERDYVSCYSSSMHWEVRPYLQPQEEHEKKIRKGGKATRIAEWHSGSEREDPPRWVPESRSLALPISAMTPTLLTAPDQIASRCHTDPGTLNRQMPQNGLLGSWREDGAPSSTVPSPLQAACHTHPSPSCKALSQCRGRGWMLKKTLTRESMRSY